MNLTEAQKSALWRLSLGAEYHISGKPQVKSLARKGLVETNDRGCTVITDAGRAALRDAEEGRE
jgi:hypothetical protein